MFLLGIVLALAGLAGAAWSLLIGPAIWWPAGLILFCFGCLLVSLASVRHAVEKSAEQIVAAINRKPVFPSPAETFAAPIPRPTAKDEIDEAAVMPTPHPERRRPSFEELTGKKSS